MALDRNSNGFGSKQQHVPSPYPTTDSVLTLSVLTLSVLTLSVLTHSVLTLSGYATRDVGTNSVLTLYCSD